MRKTVVLLFLFLLVTPLFAQKGKEVILRHSRQDAAARIVIEADDETIRSLNTVASPLSVRIDFPEPFELKKAKDFPYETSQKDRTLQITLKQVKEVRSYKLSGPPRLVIEMKLAQQQEAAPAKEASKPPVPSTPGDQKSQLPAPAPKAGEPSTEKTSRSLNIILDAGHGGYDTGISSEKSKEKDAALLLARDLGAALTKKGHKVTLTRRADQALPLSERISFLNSRKPEIAISLHASTTKQFVLNTASIDDQSADPTVRLYSTSMRQGRHLEKSRAIAKALGDAFKKEAKTDAMLRELPAPILVSVDAPSVIVEFPLTPDPNDQKTRDRMINAMMKGLFPNE